jgi:hypothetical protein
LSFSGGRKKQNTSAWEVPVDLPSKNKKIAESAESKEEMI